MKKIGILTFHNYDNYGAILQSYALERKLHEFGAEAEIIDYDCAFISNPFRLVNLKTKGFFNYIYAVIGHICYIPRSRRCNLFRRHIKYGSTVNRKNIAEKTAGYDMLITGSDQVWDYKLTNGDTTYLLDFASEDVLKCSYAASIGEHLPGEERAETYSRLLKRFDKILCRESYGADVVEQLTGERPETACDPTLLMTGEEWTPLLKEPKIRGKYILVYQLGINPSLVGFVKNLQKKTGLKVVYVPFPLVGLMKCRINIGIGPAEWMGYFKNAEYVVSDSFHGVVFSLLFNRKFFAMVNGHHRNRRVEELLRYINLSDRAMETMTEDHLLDPIDFTYANEKIAELRADSLKKLRALTELEKK